MRLGREIVGMRVEDMLTFYLFIFGCSSGFINSLFLEVAGLYGWRAGKEAAVISEWVIEGVQRVACISWDPLPIHCKLDVSPTSFRIFHCFTLNACSERPYWECDNYTKTREK